MKKKSEKQKLKEKAWKLFSEYIRRKYVNQEGIAHCYTCGKPYHWKNLQCGHGIGGRTNAILLGLPGSVPEKLCRPQCYGCNVGRQGNYEVFIPKLIREYGLEEYERFEQLKHQPVKVSIAEYEQIILELQAQLDEFNEIEDL